MVHDRLAGFEQSEESLQGKRDAQERHTRGRLFIHGDEVVKVNEDQTVGEDDIGNAVTEDFVHVLFQLHFHVDVFSPGLRKNAV